MCSAPVSVPYPQSNVSVNVIDGKLFPVKVLLILALSSNHIFSILLDLVVFFFSIGNVAELISGKFGLFWTDCPWYEFLNLADELIPYNSVVANGHV